MTGKYFLIKICFTLKTSFLCQKYITSHLLPDDFSASVGRHLPTLLVLQVMQHIVVIFI